MRLALTRPVDQGATLRPKLEACGFDVVLVPLIQIQPPSDGGQSLQKALQKISQYQWLVLTSQNAVDAVARYLPVLPPALQVITVGPKTAAQALLRGWKTRTPSQSKGSLALLSLFDPQKIRNEKILYPRSETGREELVCALKKIGASVDVVDAYQTVPTDIAPEALKQALNNIDVILFFSPSAVEAFNQKAGTTFWSKRVDLIPIGPTTAKAMEEKGYQPAFVPAEVNEDLFVEELKGFFKSRG